MVRSGTQRRQEERRRRRLFFPVHPQRCHWLAPEKEARLETRPILLVLSSFAADHAAQLLLLPVDGGALGGRPR